MTLLLTHKANWTRTQLYTSRNAHSYKTDDSAASEPAWNYERCWNHDHVIPPECALWMFAGPPLQTRAAASQGVHPLIKFWNKSKLPCMTLIQKVLPTTISNITLITSQAEPLISIFAPHFLISWLPLSLQYCFVASGVIRSWGISGHFDAR